MKLLHKYIDYHDKSGKVSLIAEDGEDMWHTYNLLQIGDQLQASTFRKVQQESSTGSVSNNRVRTTLTIKIEAIDFDSKGCTLHVKGRNVEKNRFVSMGSYHTLDLELNRKFVLCKSYWDSVHLDRINIACDPSHTADVAAVVMQEGLANVCLVLSSMTLIKAKVEVPIPRKRRGHTDQHDKGVIKFFDAIVQAILNHINFDVVKCVILASPGFLRDQFYQHLFSEALKTHNKLLIDNKSKFVRIHSSSGFVHSLKDILTDKLIAPQIADTKAFEEIKALDDFYKKLQNDSDRACYGLKHVIKANKADAIEVLLVTDGLIRSHDIAERKLLVEIVDSVKSSGGSVKMFSSMHSTGIQLTQMTGIAAIMRFPVPGIDDVMDEDSDDSDF